MDLSGGDMRKVLNVLQSTWMAFKDITEDNVYTCVGHPLKKDIDNIVYWLLNDDDFKETYQKINKLKLDKGLALEDILTQVHLYIQRIELPPRVISQLIIKMGNIEERLNQGCTEKIQISALVAAFRIARNQVTVDDE